MKATRAAIKTAKNLEELAEQVAQLREQMNRVEDMLLALVGGNEPTSAPEPAKTGARK